MDQLGLVTQYIGGRDWSDPQGALFATEHPGTGQKLADVAESSGKDIEAAASVAKAACKSWAETPAPERGRILRRVAQLLRDETPRLARLETLDCGKPIGESLGFDIGAAADAFDYFASLAASLAGEHVSLPGAMAYTRREPYGVVAAIGAWNYPLQIAAWKAAPALACGNTVLYKPSELTPITALELARIMTRAGLPAGVFNVLQGGAEVGRQMVARPEVSKVTLTGSVATGQKVAALAGQHLKKVTLELGGKSPLIVWDDANLDDAVGGILLGNVYTQGEICSNGTRIFLHRRCYHEVVERLLSRIRTLRVGDPLDPATQVGALISRDHLTKVQDYISLGKKEGAELLWGGTTPLWTRAESQVQGGHYIVPAVFAGCRDEMTIAREEIFGPVLSLFTFDDEEEVVQRANQLDFGLAAGIFTKDLTRAHRMAAHLEAGVVWINNYNVTPLEVPFGGVKHSGLGRENGRAAIDEYTRFKTVYVELSGVQAPF